MSRGRAESGRRSVGHPIDVATGEYFASCSDLALSGAVPLELTRTYSTRQLQGSPLEPAAVEAVSLPFGPGWRGAWDVRLRETLDGYGWVGPDGAEIPLPGPKVDGPRSPGTLLSPAAGLELRRLSADRFAVARYGRDRSLNEYVFERRPGNRDLVFVAVARSAAARVDIGRDEAGRIVSLRQTREQRRLVFLWDAQRIRRAELHLHDGSRRLVAEYDYDELGRLVSVADRAGRVFSYAYDEHDRMLREQARRGSTYVMRYDSRGRCNYVSGDGGFQERSLAWDDIARRVRVANSHGHVTTYDYNEAGKVVRFQNPSGWGTRFDFDELGRIVREVAGESVVETAYDAAGRTAAKTWPGGARRAFEYDDRHWLIAYTDEGGSRTEMARNEIGSITALRYGDGATWRYSYNEFGERVGSRSPLGTERAYVHDERGNVVREIDGRGNAYEGEYNALGQPVARTDSLGGRTTFRYDALDRLQVVSRPDGRSWTRTANSDGTEVIVTRPDGRRSVASLSPCGQTQEVIDYDGYRVRYEWDTEPGRLLSIINAHGDAYSMEYDADGNVTRRTTFDGRVFVHEWREGRLRRTVDGSGREISYEYDALGQLLRRNAPEGSVDYAYDARGCLVAVVTADADVRYEYDARGICVAEIQNGFGLRHTFDADGRRIESVSDAGDRTEYDYDPNGDCVRLAAFGSEVRFEHDALGREVRRHLGGAGVFDQTYDGDGRLETQAFRSSRAAATAPEVSRAYGYDAAGLLSGVRDSARGDTLYAHDGRGHLLVELRNQGTSSFFRYDGAGNRVFQCQSAEGMALWEAAGATDTYTLSAMAARLGATSAHHALASGNKLLRVDAPDKLIELEYDGSGCVVRKSVWRSGADAPEIHRFEWNSRGQLVEARLPNGAVWSYRYDGLGRRIAKTSPAGSTTRFVWDGRRLLHELAGSARHRSWLHPPDARPPVMVSGAKCHYLLHGIARSCLEVVSEDGAITQVDRGTWGEGSSSKHGEAPFFGQYLDEETGLHYNFFRYYDPEIGRYISPDPIGLRGGLNVYAFVPSPVAFIDELGLTSGPTTEGGCAGGGGGEDDEKKLRWVPESEAHALDRHSPHRPPGADGKGTEFPRVWSEAEYTAAVEAKANDPGTTWTPVPPERNGVGKTAYEPITINGETRKIFIVAEVPDEKIPGTGPGVITSAFPRHKNK